MIELKNMKAARLWMLPPAAMEVAIELLWEDKLAHPQWRVQIYFSLYQRASRFGECRSLNH